MANQNTHSKFLSHKTRTTEHAYNCVFPALIYQLFSLDTYLNSFNCVCIARESHALVCMCLSLITSFPARWLAIFPRLVRLHFFRACHWLPVFSRLVPVTCFPALVIGYLFSRAWYRLHVFPALSLVSYMFPALVIGKLCFPRLALVPCFPAL